MPIITSPSNPRYKQLSALQEHARERRIQKNAVWEGIHLVQVAVQQHLPIQHVWMAESALPHTEIAHLCNTISCEIFQVPDALWRRVASVQPDVGVLAVVSIPSLPESIDLRETTLVLEKIQDPGNLGTMLRTAAAVGIQTVLCTEGCADAWSPKVLRAGMGAHAYLQIWDHVAEATLHAVLRATTLPVIITLLQGDCSLYELPLQHPCVWVFGNEGEGVSVALQALATRRVRIPQPGGIESLNVTAAAAVCLYEQVRQQSASFS